MSSRHILPAFLVFVLLVTVPGFAQRVLKVPSQYQTIQAAIDAARDLDTVLVAPGLHEAHRLDFKAKKITVRSEAGPGATIIRDRSDAIVMHGGLELTLEGFTIEGRIDCGTCTIRNNVILGPTYEYQWPGIYCSSGSPFIVGNTVSRHDCRGSIAPPLAAGIHCDGASPVIRNNVISENMCGHQTEDEGLIQGVGIYLRGSGTIDGNLVVRNSAWARDLPERPTASRTFGAGMYVLGPVTIVNNVVALNSAESDGMHATSIYVSEGGGIYADASAVIRNNTVYGNRTRVKFGNGNRGGGIQGGKTIVNTIAWNNQAAVGPQIHGTAAVSYCNVEGGWPGPGNLDRDPEFVAAGSDFHLRWPSPCRNAGSNAGVGSTPVDFEGDERTADGTVDVGADEFFPHLYHLGTPTPGGTIQVNFIGKPAMPTWWGFSLRVLEPPVSIPGLTGVLHLDPSCLGLIAMGPIPSTGVITLPYKLDPGFPRISIPMQALLGTRMSNLDVVRVQ